MALRLTETGKRQVAGNVSLSLDAWTALDYMAVEDGCGVGGVLQKLVTAEAKRRLETKSVATITPVVAESRPRRNVSDEERKRRSERLKAVWASKRSA